MVLLSQAQGDRAILAKQLGISEHQLSYIAHSNSGEGLLFFGNTTIPFVDRFPRGEIYNLLTTRPEDIREAAKKTASVTKRIAGAVFRFIRSNPKIIVLAACVFLLIVLLQSCMGAMLSIGNSIAGAIGGTSYLAEDGDINQTELAYSEWEADLTLEARNAAQSHPGYDEYRFDIDPTGHDPHALLAFLTAKYDDFTFAQVEPVLRDIFNQQYNLTFTEIVEVRYRTEYYTCENGHEHSYQVPYNYYIYRIILQYP